MSPRKRLGFVLCFVAVVAALAMHRWPLLQPASIDLPVIQQRVEALRQEVVDVPVRRMPVGPLDLLHHWLGL